MSKFAVGYAMKKKMAKGGEALTKAAGTMTQGAHHAERLENIKAMPKPNLPMAEGGGVGDKELDMVGRIMKHRECMSQGGVVANSTELMADSEPAEFDDLVLDDHLEGHNSGADDGDDLGDAQEDHDRKDIVSRIMKSRAKGDRMPRPA